MRRDEGFTLHSSKSTNKDKQELRDKLAQLPGSDLPGFFPLRGDFDYEYEVSKVVVCSVLICSVVCSVSDLVCSV